MSIRIHTVAQILLVVSCALLVGCLDVNYNKPEVHDVEYRGHHYIVFRAEATYGQTYVHDPDCPCHKTGRD